MEKRKIPYGVSDYQKIKTENYVYVDKTKYIEILENLNTSYPIFLRPRRFGKSLFVSTLQYYYDINSQDRFHELFGDTYIGSHKTAASNSYYVMRFDFSGLSIENEDQLIATFRKSVEDTMIQFENMYQFGVEYDRDEVHPARLIGTYLTKIYPFTQKRVYIMVDEYDHFANGLLHDKKAFEGITGKDGFVRQFYEIFKYHAGHGCIDRIFITGVTSLTLDSLTSGFNIAKNISMIPYFNDMAGFTKEETLNLLKEAEIPDELEIIQLLENNYNGYLFHQESANENKRVFNSNMILYFLDEYQIRNRIPDKLVDYNIKSDYYKLTNMFNLLESKEERQKILDEIISDKGISTDIITNFNFSVPFKEEDFLSLLFYLGLLTIKGKGHTFDVILQTPNAVIRDVYYQYYSNYLNLSIREKRSAISNLALKNDFTELNKLIDEILVMHSNDDYRGFNEARLKSIFISCFSDQNLFLVKSEYPVEGKKIDIALFDQYGKSDEIKNNYLIEIKYIKKSQSGKGAIATVRKEAEEQMRAYLNLREFKNNTRVKGLIYVVVKDKIIHFEEIDR